MRASFSEVTAARPATGGLSALVAAGVLWGTGGPLGSLLGRATGLSMLAVADYRLLVGGAAIISVLAAARRGLPRGTAAWRRICLVGLLSAVFQSAYFTAIALTSVSLATLITIGATPVLVLVTEVRTGSQRVTGRVLVTVLLALAGLGLLTGIPPGRIGLVQVLAGSAAALVSAAGFAAVTLLGARPVDGLDELTMTGTGFAIGGALLAPFAVLSGGLGFAPAPAALGLVLALGLVPTAAAYLLYFRALRDASAGTAAVLSLIEPLTATVLAVLFLGERVNAATIGGGVLLTAAVLLASASERDRHRRIRQPGQERAVIRTAARACCRAPGTGRRRRPAG